MSRPFAINLDKLFRETSKHSRPFKEAMDEGMIPSKEFPYRYRFSKFKQFSIVAGISADKLFSETSKELYDKLSNSNKEKRVIKLDVLKHSKATNCSHS